MNPILETYLNALFFIPGLAHLITFILILVVLTLFRKKASWDLIPRAILLTCTIFFVLGIFDNNGPLYFVTIGVIAFISLLGRNYPRAFERAVLPVSIFAYAACWLLFTQVPTTAIIPAKVEPYGHAVDLIYGPNNTMTAKVEDPQIVDYVKTMANDKVEITVRLLYDWGKLAGASIVRVNDQKISTAETKSAAIYDDNRKSPYPLNYLGIRTKF